jgi:hypothetical protein
MECALFSLHIKVMFNEPLKKLLHMLYVFLQGVGVNQDVINVDEKAVDYIVENLIHKRLEDGGSVSKAIGHDEVFVSPWCDDKRCLPFVAIWDTDKVICTSQFCIDVGEFCIDVVQGSLGSEEEGNCS